MNDVSDGAVVARPSGASAHALIAREAQDILVQMRCAREYPRDVLEARERVLRAFQRPGLCEKALYAYSRGGTDIQGLSIRAAEELARQWGNLRCGVVELSRAGGVSEVLAFAQDLETGFSDEKRFHVRHIRDTKQGPKPLLEDRDVYEHVANLAARRKRACILAVIPSDICAEAEEQIQKTLHEKVKMTPERIRSMLTMFEGLGVTKEAIETRIQRRIDAMLPQQFLQLGRIYTSIQDGMSEAGEWFEIAAPAVEPAGRTDPPQPQGKPPESRTEELKEQLRSRQAKDQQGGEQPDTAQRGEVMNPPGGAAPEAGNLSTPPSKGARASPPAKASGAQRAPAGAPAKKTAAAAGHGTAASRPTASAAEPEPSGSPAAAAASGAEPAASGSTGDEDAIPHFDTETAITAIKSTTSLGQFKDITNQVADDFRDTDREVPQEVLEASERQQEHICINLIRAGTSIKKLNANYDRVVASYGQNIPDVVVEAFRSQQAAIERVER